MSEEQGGSRKGRGSVGQIFAMKMLVEEYLGKDKKLYAAFMDLNPFSTVMYLAHHNVSHL